MSDIVDVFEPDYWAQLIERAVSDVVSSHAATGHAPEVLRQNVLVAVAAIMSDPKAPKISEGRGDEFAALLIAVTKALGKLRKD